MRLEGRGTGTRACDIPVAGDYCMLFIESIIQWVTDFISTWVVPPWLLIGALLGTGIFLTIRLGFLQVRYFFHGLAVTTGRYEDKSKPGDVSHFQALTTALSATVGVGNIAGVAIAIHWGGPGALFWMWCTAFLGMAVKYTEVTLALKYRQEDDHPEEATAIEGTVSGGPMYYIEKGMGLKFLAVFFAGGLLLTSFLTGNAIQANTLSDLFFTKFGMPTWQTGILSTFFVGLVIFGGIKRIGKVTSVLAPLMALVYITGAMIILFINYDQVIPAFHRVMAEAFNPVSGVAGTGAGVFLMTLVWGVKRGLFSNEAGQGSAPIAHSAAQTDEPVSEGVVALLGPFIDTLVICSLTGLVIITTQTWDARYPTEMSLDSGDVSYVHYDEEGAWHDLDAPENIVVHSGIPDVADNMSRFAWNDIPVDAFFLDKAMKLPFEGRILPAKGVAELDASLKMYDAEGRGFALRSWLNSFDQPPATGLVFRDGELEDPPDGKSELTLCLDPEMCVPFSGTVFLNEVNGQMMLETDHLFAEAVETSAPLTAIAFSRDLGSSGEYIVILCVALFAISTAISWSYYGDRCAYYLFGKKSIVPYKVIFLGFHLLGAVASLNVIWGFGDVALSIVTLPNLIALIYLSGKVATMSTSYFQRRPWENKEVL